MKNHTCLINQPAGLGDVLVCLKIANEYKKAGYRVIWPLIPSILEMVKKYIDADFVEFVDIETYDTKGKDFDIVLNLDGAGDRYPNAGIVDAKYLDARIDTYDDWVYYFDLVRDKKKEKKLLDLVYKKISTDKFTLVNRNYGTPPNVFIKDFAVNTDNDIVEMQITSDYTIFDWIGVIEKADEVWTVDTCIHYIMDHPSVKLNAKRLEMFSRYVPANFETVVKKVLINKDWNLNT